LAGLPAISGSRESVPFPHWGGWPTINGFSTHHSTEGAPSLRFLQGWAAMPLVPYELLGRGLIDPSAQAFGTPALAKCAKDGALCTLLWWRCQRNQKPGPRPGPPGRHKLRKVNSRSAVAAVANYLPCLCRDLLALKVVPRFRSRRSVRVGDRLLLGTPTRAWSSTPELVRSIGT
jgi:hypothetical protein